MGGLNDFIFFKAHFLSVNVFQGEGAWLMNYFYLLHSWGGCKSRQFTVYHMCKTWLQKVHSGWDTGG